MNKPEHPIDIVDEAIIHLARTDRGRQALAAASKLHDVVVHLDTGNSEALLALVKEMTGHRINGTLYTLLQPYQR